MKRRGNRAGKRQQTLSPKQNDTQLENSNVKEQNTVEPVTGNDDDRPVVETAVITGENTELNDEGQGDNEVTGDVQGDELELSEEEASPSAVPTEDNVPSRTLIALGQYTDNMGPTLARSPAEVVQYQVYLYNQIRVILLNEDRDEQARAFADFVEWFKENRSGVTSEQFVFRGFNQLQQLGKDGVRDFETILSVMTDITNESQAVAITRRINWEAAQRACRPEHGTVFVNLVQRHLGISID